MKNKPYKYYVSKISDNGEVVATNKIDRLPWWKTLSWKTKKEIFKTIQDLGKPTPLHVI